MIRSSSTPPSLHVERLDGAAVADDRDGVGDLLDLVELVADDDQVMPWSRRPPEQVEQVLRSRSSFSAAVGSSRMSSLTSLDSALAISTSCCLPTPMSRIDRVAGSRRRPTRASSSTARRWRAFQSMTPRLASSLPRKMFSAIDS